MTETEKDAVKSDDKPLRLFVGVRVSLATARALSEVVQVLRREPTATRTRWVSPASYHVTVKFLGWTRPAAVPAVRDRVAAHLCGTGGFELETRGLGAFPSPERARVVWAGVDERGAARLAELAARVDRAAAEIGFMREVRPYHAHVTLGRLKVPSDVRGPLSGVTEQTYRETWVSSLVLFKSQIKSTGSEYIEVSSWSFEGGSKALRRHTEPVESEPASDMTTELPVVDAPTGEAADGELGSPKQSLQQDNDHGDSQQ